MCCHCHKVAFTRSVPAVAEGVDGRLYTLTTADNIAEIITVHSANGPFRIHAKHRYTDPLHFLLLFPNGELGWRPNILRVPQ